MKIIGQATTGVFICTATEDELCQVAGHAGSYGLKDIDKPQIGRELKVSELWRALNVSRQRKGEITKLANELRATAGRVDSINQALAAPIIEVEVPK